MKTLPSVSCLAAFEERLSRVASKHPDMPRQEVVLTRLSFHIFARLQQALDETVAPFGLSTGGWMTLVMLYSDPGQRVTPSDLSRTLVASPANITRLTDELVRHGWLQRQPSEADRRVLYLTLTADGEALVREVLPTTWRFYREIWGGVTDAERQVLEHAMRKLSLGLDGRQPEPIDGRRRPED